MIRPALIVLALVAVICTPWPFAFVLAIVAAFASPLAPLAVGIFADTLYYAHGVPWATVLGLFVTLAAFGVHALLETRIMRA